MARSSTHPHVAILVGTARDWGRNLVKGILSYTDANSPWHVWVRPNAGGIYDALPKGWSGEGVIARVNSPQLAEELNNTGVPVVNVADTLLDNFSAPCVRTDDVASSHLAAEHFIDRGFQNFAIVSPLHRPTANWYTNTFINTLAAQGFPCERFTIDRDQSHLAEELIPWLQSLPKPIGILALGQGHIVVDCCRETGISVPHDVAVLSSNYDELLCHACFPSLSGIISPTEQIGYRAAELLQDMLDGKDVPHENIYLPPNGIVERLSTDTLAVKDPQLVQVVEYIREHAFEHITLKDILSAVPMARRSLDRRFQQAFGRSPTDEIRRLRINKVRQLLADTNMPMQLIAEASGYATYNYLTHVFKQTTGMTPSEYRKQLNK